MGQFGRIATASRVFSLAAILGLALAFGNVIALQVTVIALAIAAAAAYLTTTTSLRQHWVIAAEAGLAGLVVALALPDSLLLLPYLVVLPLIAGLAHGIVGASSAIALQLSAMLTLTLTSSGLVGIEQRIELIAPWTLTIVGSGLLGSWVKAIGRAPSGSAINESYESARRLLGHLRTLARQLSTGLDPESLAAQILDQVSAELSLRRAAVFVRTEGGVVAPLAYQGAGARDMLDPADALVEECWSSGKPRLREDGGSGVTLALPLRLGTSTVGVVVSDDGAGLDAARLRAFQGTLDELSMRLDAALTFDEVRNLVTADERQRIAREIHDGVAQEIASLGYVVDEISAMSEEPKLVDSLRQLRSDLSRVVNELRLSIFDLRTEVGQGTGIGSALSDYVRKVGARSALTVHLTLDEAPTRLSPRVETELFRIAQEAVTNARKHSSARNLWVHCRVRPPYAEIEIRDDGVGVGRGRDDSYGLKIMQERAAQIDAHVSVGPHTHEGDRPGTRVAISVGSPPEQPSGPEQPSEGESAP